MKFSGDKAVKTQADKIFTKKVKEKKVEKPGKVVEKKITQTEELLEQRSQFKPLGKIDLDNIGKKSPVKNEPEVAPETTAESPVAEPEVEEKDELDHEAPVVETPVADQPEPGKNRKPLKQLMTQRLLHLV